MSNTAQPAVLPVQPGAKTALLLMDYHNALVHMIQPDQERTKVVSAAGKLLQAAREHSSPISHCLIDADQDPLPTSRLRERWSTTFKPLAVSQPHMLREWPDLAPLSKSDGHCEITSVRTPGIVSALKSGELLEFLKTQRVECLVLGGIATGGVVISTAREAADLGFVTAVVEEACWDPKSDAHKTLVEDVLPMTCWVVDLQKGLELLGGSL